MRSFHVQKTVKRQFLKGDNVDIGSSLNGLSQNTILNDGDHPLQCVCQPRIAQQMISPPICGCSSPCCFAQNALICIDRSLASPLLLA